MANIQEAYREGVETEQISDTEVEVRFAEIVRSIEEATEVASIYPEHRELLRQEALPKPHGDMDQGYRED